MLVGPPMGRMEPGRGRGPGAGLIYERACAACLRAGESGGVFRAALQALWDACFVLTPILFFFFCIFVSCSFINFHFVLITLNAEN